MGGEAWERGRRAWDRLAAWHRRDQPGDAGDADRALDALDDISVVRRLLEQAELAAVRTARGAGKSWAEIATMLGITRQSAWERWRDLDEGDSAPSKRTGPPVSPTTSATEQATEEAVARAASSLRRRRSQVNVPNVISLSWDDALTKLSAGGLVAVGPDPDRLPPEFGSDMIVTDQSPESGARVERGSAVTLWTERRGGSGVREPRRPKVPPGTGRQLRDEETNEAVG
jgi:PASTA domain